LLCLTSLRVGHTCCFCTPLPEIRPGNPLRLTRRWRIAGINWIGVGSGRFFSRHLGALFSRFRQPNRYSLLAAFHLATFSAFAGTKRSPLSAPHRALYRLACGFPISPPARSSSRTLSRTRTAFACHIIFLPLLRGKTLQAGCAGMLVRSGACSAQRDALRVNEPMAERLSFNHRKSTINNSAIPACQPATIF
jgi:hypothetical protein